MIIRDATVLDLSDLTRTYNQAVLSTAATLDVEAQTLEQRSEWFSHYGDKYPLLVAEISGRVVGYCSISRYRTKPGYDRTVESSVYVDAAFHGRGIGRELMREALHRASDIGYHVVIAGITEGNDASVRLHASLGFQHVGRLREVGRKFDQWQDVNFYELVLT
ncbi:MAG: GNAT family N-acetyltransferase [Thermaerobacter sp.]|nr:GNAT family N-acetyltransferase [Thermaerobacter sp.]